jgi:hypothetical protein
MYLTDYRAIFFDRHYAPARVMPLLAALRRHATMPNIDIVVAGNDEPKVPAYAGERLAPIDMMRNDHPKLPAYHCECVRQPGVDIKRPNRKCPAKYRRKCGHE